MAGRIKGWKLNLYIDKIGDVSSDLVVLLVLSLKYVMGQRYQSLMWQKQKCTSRYIINTRYSNNFNGYFKALYNVWSTWADFLSSVFLVSSSSLYQREIEHNALFLKQRIWPRSGSEAHSYPSVHTQLNNALVNGTSQHEGWHCSQILYIAHIIIAGYL